MLNEKNISFVYREYKKEPLTKEELKKVLSLLDVAAHTLLRKRDKMYKELQLQGNEDDTTLIEHFSKYPTLMERPIFIHNDKAIVCRPFDKLLEIL